MKKNAGKKRVIGVDFDDVLFGFNRAMAAYSRDKYGTSYTYDDIKSYALNEACGCTPEEVTRRIYEFYDTEYDCNGLPLVGAVEAVKELSRDNELIIITARPRKEGIFSWLEKHFEGLFSKVIFSNPFHNDLDKNMSKAVIAEKEGVGIFIEDAAHHANSLSIVGIPVILLNSPWNKEAKLNDGIIRVDSWKDILKEISSRQ